MRWAGRFVMGSSVVAAVGLMAPVAGLLTKKWSVRLGGTTAHGPAAVSYPVIAGGRVFLTVQNSQNYGTELFALSVSTGSVDWSVGLGGLYCFSALTYDGWRLFALNFRDDGFRTGKPDPNPMQDVDFTKARLRGLEFRRLNLHSVSFERPRALLVEGHNRPPGDGIAGRALGHCGDHRQAVRPGDRDPHCRDDAALAEADVSPVRVEIAHAVAGVAPGCA